MRPAHRSLAFVLLMLAGGLCRGEELPSRPFTTQDGLPINRINDILADSHGLLWFASSRGLTRFDGYDFHTFTEEDRLPSSSVTALLEARDGTLWLGAGKQLCHFQPSRHTGEFTSFDLAAGDEVNTLFQDRRGRIWCGTLRGLFVLNPLDKQPRLTKLALDPGGDPAISAIAEDSSGVVWAGFLQRLYRLAEGQQPQAFSAKTFGGRISSLLPDNAGGLWVGTWNGLYRLNPNAPAGSVEHAWTEQDGLSSRLIQALFRSRDGNLWALTEHGLTGWDPRTADPQFHKYDDTGGWLTHGLYGMAEDPAGSLWVMTEASGVVKVSRNGLTQFHKADGLRSVLIRDVLEDRAHNLIAVTRIDSPDPLEQSRYRGPILHVLKGNRLTPVVPLYPHSLTKPGWGERQIVLQDHCREWWIATEQGLLHYPAVNVEDLPHSQAMHFYTKGNGLPSSDVFRLAEDAAGNIWIGTMGGGVSLWNRKTGKVSDLRLGDSPGEMMGDPAGNMWLGLWFSSGLLRYHDGKFKQLGENDGLAPGAVRGLLFDHAGRLWVASTGGLSMAEQPLSDSLHFRRYTANDGFTARHLFSLAEGSDHRLYIGSEDGLDELDPVTGRIRHYGMQDGLPTEEVLAAFRDSKGTLWFGTHAGLVRLQPTGKYLQDTVQLRVTSLLAGGKTWPISKLGASDIDGLRIDPDHNSVELRFADLAFGSAGPLLYQYQAGASATWSHPSANRTLTFVGLSPGSYKIQARALDPLGRVRSAPILLGLTVLTPFWRTWWFEFIILASAVGVISLVLHYRIARIMAVQQIRTRISSDLHDDIGSGLSQIAIWSDIAQRETGAEGAPSEALERIASASRSLVDSISDIVWSVNPRRDSLRELLQRIRYFASEVCSSHEIALEFNAPAGSMHQAAGSVLRHDVYLLVKEAVFNAAKHSGCTVLRIDVEVAAKVLAIRIADNGRGMPDAAETGNGLQTMRQRAQHLGGRVSWVTEKAKGTTVHFQVALKGGRDRNYTYE